LLRIDKFFVTAFVDRGIALWLQSVGPCASGSTNRQDMLTHATAIGTSVYDLFRTLNIGDVDQSTQELILHHSKSVATAASALIASSKAIAASCTDTALQNIVITSAKSTALSASQLIACARVLAPVVHDQSCQEELLDAGKYVAASVEDLASSCQAACASSQSLKRFADEAQQVSQSLELLFGALANEHQNSKHEDDCDVILQSADAIQSALGNSNEMLRQTKSLVVRTTGFLNELKSDVNIEPSKDKKTRLSKGLQSLTVALNAVVEAAKAVAKQTTDPSAQISLANSMDGLRSAVEQASSGAVLRKALKRLTIAARQACTTMTQLNVAAQSLHPRIHSKLILYSDSVCLQPRPQTLSSPLSKD
jgi:talin